MTYMCPGTRDLELQVSLNQKDMETSFKATHQTEKAITNPEDRTKIITQTSGHSGMPLSLTGEKRGCKLKGRGSNFGVGDKMRMNFIKNVANAGDNGNQSNSSSKAVRIVQAFFEVSENKEKEIFLKKTLTLLPKVSQPNIIFRKKIEIRPLNFSHECIEQKKCFLYFT